MMKRYFEMGGAYFAHEGGIRFLKFREFLGSLSGATIKPQASKPAAAYPHTEYLGHIRHMNQISLRCRVSCLISIQPSSLNFLILQAVVS